MGVIPSTRHPAKYSEPVLKQLDRLVQAEQRDWGRPITLFDPFAGVGRIHQLGTWNRGKVHTVGMEIEQEWASCHRDTMWGDSLAYMETTDDRYHVVATSPCYANRLSDHHEARDGSVRRSYRHDLGRMPSECSNATMPWGPKYWAFMARAYRGMHRVLHPGGVLLLNVSDFVSKRELIPAATWHDGACWGAGFTRKDKPIQIATQRMRFGENREARADHEVILVLHKADQP